MLPYLDAPFTYAAGILGASTDELKLITSFLLSYPFAGLLKRIPDSKPALKNLFIIGVSSFYLLGLFDLWGGTRTLAISSIGAYCIAKYVQGPFMPWIGFVFLMGHFYETFCILLERCRWSTTRSRTIRFSKGEGDQTTSKLVRFCWICPLFPSLFAGPAFDYVDYKQWIETTMFEVPPGVDPSKKAPTRKLRKIPRSGTPAMWKAAAGLSWILLFLKAFCVYYGVWALTEGACILSGLGYKGIDPVTGKVSWDRLCNVDPWGVETAQNTRAYLGNWNINTNNWLRNYIYLRVTPKAKSLVSELAWQTFVTSAFWHGFFPGYYLAFILASFIQNGSKELPPLFPPFFVDPKTTQPTPHKLYYDLFSWLATQLAFSFTVAPFILLTLPASFLVWSRVYFYAIIGTALSTAFFASPA
ncbi:hypothetical protein EYC84_003240 [Monilinia fructicola]|uniref:Wax synthase domain-containing protein n=1 Tax=Monilinia fructicola TaxID=38448 RepID=A0A5M9JTW3_MONFR|nr:hypothetical protein EYC84_003240 [Monilinia fructicola]